MMLPKPSTRHRWQGQGLAVQSKGQNMCYTASIEIEWHHGMGQLQFWRVWKFSSKSTKISLGLESGNYQFSWKLWT